MAGSEHLWLRYLPGLAAAGAGAALIGFASPKRRIPLAVLATLLGLVCMEAEYWVAHGFPKSEVPFFTAATAFTLTALALGKLGGVGLGVAGLAFFASVNIRYGAPYLLDYVLPVLYAILLALARRELNWFRPGIFGVGRAETLWLILVNALAVWRTTVLGKWGWLSGRPW